jgi:hypothetical protein
MFETARNITLGKDISYRGKKNSCTLKASQPSSTTLHHCTSLSAIDAASALRAPRRRIFSFSQAGRSSSSRMADQRWEEEKNGCEKARHSEFHWLPGDLLSDNRCSYNAKSRRGVDALVLLTGGGVHWPAHQQSPV